MWTSNDTRAPYAVCIIFFISLDKKRFWRIILPSLSFCHSLFLFKKTFFSRPIPVWRLQTGCCKPLLPLLFQAFDMCDWNHSLSSPTGAFKAQTWCFCVFAWWKLWEIRKWLCKANATRGGDVSVKTNTHLHKHSRLALQNYSNFHLII